MLTRKQKQAIEMIAFEGMRESEVALFFGYNTRTVARWRQNNEEYAACLDEAICEANRARRLAYKGIANKAIETVADLLDSPNQRIRLDAAKEVLRLAGDYTEDSMENKSESGIILMPEINA